MPTTTRTRSQERVDNARHNTLGALEEMTLTEDDGTLADWSLRVALAFLETAQQQLDGTIPADHPRAALAYALLGVIEPRGRGDVGHDDIVTTLRYLTGDEAW